MCSRQIFFILTLTYLFSGTPPSLNGCSLYNFFASQILVKMTDCHWDLVRQGSGSLHQRVMRWWLLCTFFILCLHGLNILFIWFLVPMLAGWRADFERHHHSFSHQMCLYYHDGDKQPLPPLHITRMNSGPKDKHLQPQVSLFLSFTTNYFLVRASGK